MKTSAPDPTRNYGLFALAIVVAAIIVGGTLYLALKGSVTATITSTTTTTSTVSPYQNSISISGLGLCSDAASCGVYPAPMSEAQILFNATVPVSMVTLYINNTYDGIIYENPATTTVACTTNSGSTCSVILGGQGYASGTVTSNTEYYATCTLPTNTTSCLATNTGSLNTVTVFADQYKGGVPSSLQPVVKGDTYVYRFVAVFQDGSAATATASTTAG